MSDQPRLIIEPMAADRALEALCITILLAMWVLTVSYLLILPEHIAIHFDMQGQPDGYGSKWVLLFSPVFASILWIGLSVLNKFPHKFNYPVKITKDNAARQYSLAIRLIRWIKLGILLLFSILLHTFYSSALSEELKNIWWIIILSVIIGLVPLIIFLIFSVKNK